MEITPRVYALKGLPPEVVAVAFAKCSRSPLPFDQIAKELTEAKSADFHEKWVINYGHASVAEHACLNLAIEDVSLLAVECLQSNRLASFTEKSSRYQIYDRERIFIPKNIAADQELKDIYQGAVNQLFDVYEKSIEPIKQAIFRLYPNKDNEPEQVWQSKIKSKWIDICRFLLPNCVLANLGMTANARTWEYAITKMLSHPLQEARELGREVKKTTLAITPTLVQFAEPNEYYILNEQYLMNKAGNISLEDSNNNFNSDQKLSVELIDYDPAGEDKVIAGLLYKYRAISFIQALDYAKNMGVGEKEQLFKNILEKARNYYDKPPRELEYPYYTFDCLLDQGAYYDLKRNRIMTQTPQILHGQYGFYTPKIFAEVGLGRDYQNAMERAHNACQTLAKKHPYEAQYLTTKATARRFIMKMNLREAFYFIGLRSRKSGHFMYRKIARMCYEHIARVHPLAAKYIMVDKEK